jgi:hypothetical protein
MIEVRMGVYAMFSLDPTIHLYSLGPCPNCHGDVWELDTVALDRYDLERYECRYCGQDVYPSHRVYRPVGPEAESVGAPSSAGSRRNTTEGG